MPLCTSGTGRLFALGTLRSTLAKSIRDLVTNGTLPLSLSLLHTMSLLLGTTLCRKSRFIGLGRGLCLWRSHSGLVGSLLSKKRLLMRGGSCGRSRRHRRRIARGSRSSLTAGTPTCQLFAQHSYGDQRNLLRMRARHSGELQQKEECYNKPMKGNGDPKSDKSVSCHCLALYSRVFWGAEGNALVASTSLISS